MTPPEETPDDRTTADRNLTDAGAPEPGAAAARMPAEHVNASTEPASSAGSARRANPALVRVLRTSLMLTTVLAVLVAVIGGVIGWSIAGWNGVLSALVGAGLTLAFAAITAASLWLGSRQGGFSFLGIVLGGWLIKIVVFIGLLAVVTSASFVQKEVLFGSIVAAVLGSLAADSFAAMRGKVPYVDDPQ